MENRLKPGDMWELPFEDIPCGQFKYSANVLLRNPAEKSFPTRRNAQNRDGGVSGLGWVVNAESGTYASDPLVVIEDTLFHSQGLCRTLTPIHERLCSTRENHIPDLLSFKSSFFLV
jgi:hypothetical protein